MKKGFTLSEILVVIILIGLLVAIAIPSIITINKRMNTRVFESKKENILAAAELYGRDNPDRFINYEFTVTVGDLVEADYVDADVEMNDNNCLDSYGCIINPVDKTSLNSKVILIRQKVKNIETIWEGTPGNFTSDELVDIIKDRLNCGEITESSPCLYVGKDADNYLWYSGVMWRIIGVYKIDGKEVAKFISDDNISFEVSSN